jgi:hypothetical protein
MLRVPPIVLAAIVFVVGCEPRSSPAPTPASTTASATTAASASGSPSTSASAANPPAAPVPAITGPKEPPITNVGLPPELEKEAPLWETAYGWTPNKASHVSRLFANGKMYTWSNARRRAAAAKPPTREPAAWSWRLDALVSAEGVARVRELVASKFAKLPETRSPSLGADQGIVVYRTLHEGREHAVVVASGPTKDLPEPIREIETAILGAVVANGVPIDQP